MAPVDAPLDDYEMVVPLDGVMELLDEIAAKIRHDQLDGPGAVALIGKIRERSQARAVTAAAEIIMQRASRHET